ncbi:unnamed protein product (macronuclear) [Paramecium tetraurelia]|uniref:Chromosome undetermined scaffold_1, whole genome shotgun sequence n=1 Tax=Paramecium tetraurelia TaxID=5888 RepID=Q6BGK5_PARTE|nr:MAP kinase [Paramecium tetraurelia strain d4-2]XP_001423504.1 uncharacterized protein GSPATT00000542001 [Paramecium tetraurelia]CAH03215.1 MAP kinase, putative [Paramecium tetraurelia]CAK56106.1 unnamed protein product [Paramecium tetraurelia]|eukprot:XP_001423504.1 hypothetical protein (macronuclear) [Paramecium tetraurelia strain d4-2]
MSKEEDHSEVEDHILRRFDLQEYKGKGAYGIVWKAYDTKTKQIVALKKVFDAFQNSTDAQRTYREVVFLKQLNNHDNIVKLISVIRADNNKDLYMVFEYMETDLHRVIRAELLNNMHIQYVMYQILKCLKYIHSGQLVHRDLKPANILINADCHIKVADFGLSRCLSETENNNEIPIMTEYVATRWYRAPEILFGSHYYSTAVDMWSVGCILGEMILGKACFAGTSTLDQIDKIIQLIGKPTLSDLESINAPMGYQIIEQMDSKKQFSYHQFFPKANDLQIDFIKKLLVYNPKKRLTAEQALDHPYLKDFKQTEPEILLDQYITIPFNDNKKLKLQDYRDALYKGLITKKSNNLVASNYSSYLTNKMSRNEPNPNSIVVKSDTEQYVFKQPTNQQQQVRCKSRLDQRSESVSKKIAQTQYFNTQDIMRIQRQTDKSKSFHIDEEMPTVHKSITKQQLLDQQVPTTTHQKQQEKSYNRMKPSNGSKLSESKENSRINSVEGTINNHLLAQAQYNFHKRLQKKKQVSEIYGQPHPGQQNQKPKQIPKKSKTPDLKNYQMVHSRSLSQNKNISVSRSSSKPKTRGSPYYSEGKVLNSQPDMNCSFSKSKQQSVYSIVNSNLPLYAKILSKHQNIVKFNQQKLRYESLKK